MKLLIVLSIYLAINLTAGDINVANQQYTQLNRQLSSNGVTVDEVVVESSLYIKPKQQRPQLRRVLRSSLSNFNILKPVAEHRRVKRQVGRYGQSQVTSNASAHQNYNSLYGFENSAANAQTQAFNDQGPKGGLAVSPAGSLTQALNGNSYDEHNSANSSQGLTLN